MAMAKEVSKKSLRQIEKDAERHIMEYNDALRKGDLKAMNDAEDALKKDEGQYLTNKQHEVFCELKNQPDPFKSAVIQRNFEVLKHTTIRRDGILMGFDKGWKDYQIDLVKLSTFLESDKTWWYKVEKFGQLLCMRAAKELGTTGVQLRQIAKSYYMRDLAKKEALGETPMSTNQVCKTLQMVVDSIPFSEGTKLKVNNHDVAYLLACYTKRGKSALSVQVAKSSFIHSLIADVCHRAATGKLYSVEFKQERQTAVAPAPVAKPTEVSGTDSEAPKAEAPKTEPKPLKVPRKKAA